MHIEISVHTHPFNIYAWNHIHETDSLKKGGLFSEPDY